MQQNVCTHISHKQYISVVFTCVHVCQPYNMYYLKCCCQFVWNKQLEMKSSGKYRPKQSAIFVTRLSPRTVYFHTNEVAILWVFYCILYLKMCLQKILLWNLTHLLNKQIDFFDKKLTFLYLKTRHCKYYTLNTMPESSRIIMDTKHSEIRENLIPTKLIITRYNTKSYNTTKHKYTL